MTLRYFYCLGAGCFYLAPMAKDNVVPVRGWLQLGAINLCAIIIAVLTYRFFPQ